MKIILKNMFAITMIGLAACGGSDTTQPGKGPGFPSDLTAQQLWVIVSADLYIPSSLKNPDGKVNNGSADCDGGGKATVKYASDDAAFKETINISYDDCSSFIGSAYDLTQNGTARYQSDAARADSSSAMQYDFDQHVSFSGKIGFAADCDYTITVGESQNDVTIKGSCKYVDSKGKELNIDGAEMTQGFLDG